MRCVHVVHVAGVVVLVGSVLALLQHMSKKSICPKDHLACSVNQGFADGAGERLGCVGPDLICDGYAHCLSGRDERKCLNKCKGSAKDCGDGRCIAAAKWCDHKKDCTDGRDEASCIDELPSNANSTCRDEKVHNATLRCIAGTSEVSTATRQVCRNDEDSCKATLRCGDGEKACQGEEFNEYRCVPVNRCDVLDCENGRAGNSTICLPPDLTMPVWLLVLLGVEAAVVCTVAVLAAVLAASGRSENCTKSMCSSEAEESEIDQAYNAMQLELGIYGEEEAGSEIEQAIDVVELVPDPYGEEQGFQTVCLDRDL